MSDTLLAAIFALITASISGPVSVTARRAGAYGNAVTGVIIGLIVNIPLLVITTVVLWEPGWWNPEGLIWFILLGLVGPSIGRVFMFQSIHRLGVARAMPLISMLPLTTAVAAFGLLGERPGPYIWVGTLLIVAGCVGMTSKGQGKAQWDRRYLWFPVMSIAGFTAGNIIRKVALTALPAPVLGVTINYISSLVFLLFLVRFMPPSYRPDLGWGKKWVFYGVCGFFNTAALMFRFMATRYGELTAIVPIFATASLFALLASWLFLRDLERITPPMATGAVLIMMGGALVAWRIL